VRTDDPRLEKSRERMFERVKKYDEMMLTVIKNHLGCEQFLNELLSASSRRWKKRTCAGKIDIAKALKLPEIEPPILKVLEAGNKLRNQIAHSPDQTKIAAKMAAFRKAYVDALTPEQARASEKLDDIKIVVLAFGLCGGYLVVAASRLTEEKKKGRRAGDV
jgi:hypothetical protein